MQKVKRLEGCSRQDHNFGNTFFFYQIISKIINLRVTVETKRVDETQNDILRIG